MITFPAGSPDVQLSFDYITFSFYRLINLLVCLCKSEGHVKRGNRPISAYE